MIKPVVQDDAFLADIRDASANRDGSAHFDLWWLGQSGYLIHWGGRYILIDPYLSDSLTRKYAHTDKPHVQMTERIVDSARLDFVNIVTSSHNHTDHLDPDTLGPILARLPRLPIFVIPEANRAFVTSRLNIDVDRPIGIDAGDTVEIGEEEAQRIEIHAIPAAHDEIERDENGHHRYLGYVFHFGRWSIYHAGDTRWDDEVVRALLTYNAHHKIDVAILPINGHAQERRVAGNLSGREAARLARMIGAGVVIPCHYDMFEFNTVKPGEFVDEARRLGQPYQILRCGERLNSKQVYCSGEAGPVLNETLAAYYTGKHILVGITYVDARECVTEQVQFDGHVARINEKEGIVIYRRDLGEEFCLPPDLASIRPAAPGEYRLRTSQQVVKDPELLTSWTIEAPRDEKHKENQE